MVWQRNDDQYGVSRKVTRIPRMDRLAAVGLDQLAKNYSVRALTDGVLDEVELAEVLATPKLIAALVDVGMWHREGHDCPKCVQPPRYGAVIHDFLEYNPSRASVEKQRADDAERKRRGRHSESRRSPAGHVPDSERNLPVPSPVPSPKTDRTTTSSSPTGVDARAEHDEESAQSRAEALGIRDLGRLRKAVARHLGILDVPSDAELLDIVLKLSVVATGHVRSWTAYIERSTSSAGIRDAWERVKADRPPAVIRLGGAA